MAESSFNSSQESLPLSQETFDALLNQLPFITNSCSENAPTYFAEIMNEENLGNLYAENEQSRVSPCYMDTTITPSALPASSNWPGSFSFQLSFPPQEDSKGDIWTYSCLKNKLYVKKDAPCPFIFSSTLTNCAGVYIRAMALYTSSQDSVHRCPSDSYPELIKGVVEANHLVRCESRIAAYISDPVTARNSVVVPYEIPSAGQQSITYIYKFMCLSSCSGGPNRRPMMVVFTLEKGGEVFGRQKVDLKVCANPSRDKKAEERKLLPTVSKEPLEKKIKQQNRNEFDGIDIDVCDPAPFGRSESSNGYAIKIQSATCYSLLRRVGTFLDFHGAGKPFELEKYLRNIMGSSEDEAYHNDNNMNKRLPPDPMRTEKENFSDQSIGHVPSDPVSESWCGPFSFAVSFPHHDSTKKNAWTYSHAINKLFVGKDIRCPISFSSTLKDYSDVYIRAVVLFKTSAEVVQRCPTHFFPEHVLGLVEAEHFVRCDSEMAVYLNDPETKRHSVVVPLERPAVGQTSTTYLYKFACFGSCSGGPNRRPLMLVFTLERRNQVLGRQVVDLKVCVCPVRDKNAAERKVHSKDQTESCKRKFSQFTADEMGGIDVDSCDRIVLNDSAYTLMVKDEKWYKLLRKMKTYYDVCKNRKSYPDRIRQYFQHIITSSSDERDE